MAATGYHTRGCQGRRTAYPRDSSIFIKNHHQDPERWQSPFSVMNKKEGKSSRRWTRFSEHIDFRRQDMKRFLGRALLLIRSPYDSVISFWNHDRTGTYNGGQGRDGLADLSASIQTEAFREFVRQEIKLWEEIYMDYLSIGSDLLVVHYEDLKTDLRGQVVRILEDLDMPVDDLRVNCSLTMPHDKVKRKARNLEDPFNDELRELIEASISRIQDMLRFRNFPLLPVEKYKWRKPIT